MSLMCSVSSVKLLSPVRLHPPGLWSGKLLQAESQNNHTAYVVCFPSLRNYSHIVASCILFGSVVFSGRKISLVQVPSSLARANLSITFLCNLYLWTLWIHLFYLWVFQMILYQQIIICYIFSRSLALFLGAEFIENYYWILSLFLRISHVYWEIRLVHWRQHIANITA